VVPAAHDAQKTHQAVEQQRRPYLPTDRVGAVAQEVAQLQALLDLFEEDFDLPPAAIQAEVVRFWTGGLGLTQDRCKHLPNEHVKPPNAPPAS
jgi:hypothetical protein